MRELMSQNPNRKLSSKYFTKKKLRNFVYFQKDAELVFNISNWVDSWVRHWSKFSNNVM